MIWREATSLDHPAVLTLSRVPMPGKIRMIWGLERVEAPPECGNLRVFVLEKESEVFGTAMIWDWPGGHRYLGGLRFSPRLTGRPPRSLWTRGYEAGLAGCEHAWTCIGSENTPARRLLLSGRRWLPRYTPRQEIRSWFIPLSTRHRRGNFVVPAHRAGELQTDDRRFAAIASGCGPAFCLGRLSHTLGLPGLPPPGRRLRIAHVGMDPEQFTRSLRGLKGLDGLIVVVPKDSSLARRWKTVIPRHAAIWDSTLYSVTWAPDRPLPEIPHWKGVCL
jgi:hypothetical protein